MKRIKLFTKLFFPTLLITMFITLLAHELLFFWAPVMGITMYKTSSTDTNEAIFIAETTIVEDAAFWDKITFQTDDYISSAIRKTLPYSMLICCIVSFIYSYFFSKSISAPIKRMAKKTTEMATLNKDIICSEKSCYEINLLSQNINELYGTLFSTIENLEMEKEKVDETEKMKVDFLRAASHELKTPVTALNAILENMVLGVGKYKDHDTYLVKCKEIAEQLSAMICDILDTSKMNLLAEDEKAVNTDMQELVTQLCIPYQTIAKSKGQTFQISVKEIPDTVLRPNLFRKALSNILMNAVCYTDAGGKISVFFENGVLVIENECIPIVEEHLKRIFEPFYRLEFSRNQNTGGSGLGLYFTATMLKVMNLCYEFAPSDLKNGMQFKIFWEKRSENHEKE